ncbi:MAG TPA: response regulator, partial [Polyangiaceae bacterium]|nr:response regulator [Polyangiaceae bacterium]
MTRVLVVDPDDQFARDVESGLTELGCEVERAGNAEGAMLLAHADRPDLILLTVELPDANGFSLCSKMRRDAKLKKVPLIVLSSEATEETFDNHRQMSTHADDYLHKPVAFPKLLSRLRPLVPIDGASAVPEKPVAAAVSPPQEEPLDVADLVGEDDDDDHTKVVEKPPVDEIDGGPEPEPAEILSAEPEAPRPEAVFPAAVQPEAAPSQAPAPVASSSATTPPARDSSPGQPARDSSPGQPARDSSPTQTAPASAPPARPSSKPSTHPESGRRSVIPGRPRMSSIDIRAASAEGSPELLAIIESLKADKALAAKREEDAKTRIARRDAQIERLQTQHTKEAQRLEQLRVQTEQDLQRRLDDAQKSHEQRLASLQKTHADELAEAAARQARAIAQVSKDFEDKLRETQSAATRAEQAARDMLDGR